MCTLMTAKAKVATIFVNDASSIYKSSLDPSSLASLFNYSSQFAVISVLEILVYPELAAKFLKSIGFTRKTSLLKVKGEQLGSNHKKPLLLGEAAEDCFEVVGTTPDSPLV